MYLQGIYSKDKLAADDWFSRNL